MPLQRPTYDDIVAARNFIRNYLPKTPLVHVWSLSQMLGCHYHIKCENFQPVGAFKVRGGVYLVGTLSDEEKRIGVISASTGNHGQSLAFAGMLFGVRVVIYAPKKDVNPMKLQAMHNLGAEVRLHGKDFDEAREKAEQVAREEGFRYVHPANEPKLIAGVGTMGLEIFEDLPDVEVIIVPIGAGSSACGNGIVAKHINPRVKIIGCQSERAPAVWYAWKERHLKPYHKMETEHEGLATRVPFELTTSILWDVLDDFILLSDEEISDAIRLLAQHAKVVAEGAGAASLAAAIKLKEHLFGKKVVGIVSGGNIPLERYAAVLGGRA
ncbi:MAG: threonine/serine dehydratase [Armatimonadota bacterium]|nr:threonine/serine dehydratase [Armatimonadota bacterium]MCX7777047.1 threonine/serine dehydratase [Armatimonadota bacterium]MDW8024885.1 threonine/serine dehydratase [Armatimonadota bacterium]